MYQGYEYMINGKFAYVVLVWFLEKVKVVFYCGFVCA